ncbi:MAG: glycosyltransferase family 9 protein [Bacteroidota bacterium]
MSYQNYFKKFTSGVLKKFLSAEIKSEKVLPIPENILVVRQHNQFGDMLASVSLFRALKETYPSVSITLLASPENYFAVDKNKYIDHVFIFDKKKLINPVYLFNLKKVLNIKYDLAIVPATVAISSTSCILAALSSSTIKIGPNSLDGAINPMNYVFNYRIDLNWKKCPDAHVSDFILDIVRPFNISTKKYFSLFTFEDDEMDYADKFIQSLHRVDDELLIGFHVGAGKPQNRWNLSNYVELINELSKKISMKFYFTGSDADKEEISYIKKYFPDAGYFLNKTIPRVSALIEISDLFITNDTGIMHVAGATRVPQISLFGPTNPFNWAPVGDAKYFIRKSDLMNDITVKDVFNLVQYVLEKHKKDNDE